MSVAARYVATNSMQFGARTAITSRSLSPRSRNAWAIWFTAMPSSERDQTLPPGSMTAEACGLRWAKYDSPKRIMCADAPPAARTAHSCR